MSGPVAAMLPGGRLHLQHGPIDLVIGAEGARDEAFAAARARFQTLLEELVAERPALSAPFDPAAPHPRGETAQIMHRATAAMGDMGFRTPMAAVAGSVAETILRAMTRAADLTRAYVNNGGDIALHLAAGMRFTTAMASGTGSDLGRITIRAADPIRGIATSGRAGRSFSLGIADSVTVLTPRAAEADMAATLIANAVDLPGHSAIARARACDLSPDSDLGPRLVVTSCGPLDAPARAKALDAGEARAAGLLNRGVIAGAALFLQGEARTLGPAFQSLRRIEHV